MEKDIHPIGTVVELFKNPTIRMMIIGYNPVNNDGVNKDYVAVAYPVGCIDNRTFFVFNNDEIKEVVFEGYKNRTFAFFKELFIKQETPEQDVENNLK